MTARTVLRQALSRYAPSMLRIVRGRTIDQLDFGEV
jgi:hypothetical protein